MSGNGLTAGCIAWIRDWFEKNSPSGTAVVGMSGGKDSTVVAALCSESLGADRVLGVAMPSGVQDINEADEICRYLGIRYISMNIGAIEQEFRNLSPDIPGAADGKGWTAQSVLNIPPRIRMTLLYAVAQTCGGMVANTCNLSEDYIGYATLYGDASGSFSPISRLTVQEVIAIGKELGIPARWIEKIPDDGLPGSCPDEEKFGFTYRTLDRYIREGECEDPVIKSKIDRMHFRNKFKTEILRIPAFEPGLPVFENMF